MEFYNVLSDNKEPNGFFDYRIRWNVKEIASDSQRGHGYIVQLITRNTIGTKSFIEKHKKDKAYFDYYYEAWPVQNYCINLEKDYGYDDLWACGDEFEKRQFDIRQKHLTMCNLTMTGTVYWVEEGTQQFETVEKDFHVEKNGPAKDLVCSRTFVGVEYLKPLCNRIYEAKWDYVNEKWYYDDLYIYENTVDLKTKSEYFRKRIEELKQLVITVN